jgi:hypothetical protein
MAFVHIVTFKWRTADHPAGPVAEALLTLTRGLDGVLDYRCGADVGRTPASYDFGVAGVFESREAFVAYRDHPEHQRILAELITPHLQDRTVVQLDDGAAG